MAGAAPILEIGQGFGTWLIPIIIFGVLGSVGVVSLIVLVCAYSCLSRRETADHGPEMTHEIYRTPTIPYRDPPSDRPLADSTTGRLVTHSRSLHVPRNQTINAHRLRSQVSSPELRNTSQPPPYAHRTMPVPLPRRQPRPHAQVYSDQIFNPGRTCIIPQQSQQVPPSPEKPPSRPERCFSASSPSSYSSSCTSIKDFSPPSTPSLFSQESPAPARTLSWVVFPEPHQDSDSDSHETKKFASARPRHRSGTGGRTGPPGQNNRRLIIVDDNLVSGDTTVPSGDFEAHTLRQVEMTRLARSTLGRTAALSTANGEKEAQIEKPLNVRSKHDRNAVFKVTCPDTSDLWKMPVIPGETLVGFAGRVKQRTGVDVILFANDEILASEEDWRAAKGGGRITAHLIH